MIRYLLLVLASVLLIGAGGHKIEGTSVGRSASSASVTVSPRMSGAAFLPSGDPFTIVVLNDSQETVNTVRWPTTADYTTSGMPDIMDAAVDEILANVKNWNIAAVIHVGDIISAPGSGTRDNDLTDYDDPTWEVEWERAMGDWSKLQGRVPVLFACGNHDDVYGCGTNVGEDWHANQNGVRGLQYLDSFTDDATAGNTHAINHAVRIWGGGRYWLTFLLDWEVSQLSGVSCGTTDWTDVDDWMDGHVTDYPDDPIIVVAHDLVSTSAISSNCIGTDNPDGFIYGQADSFLALGGHFTPSGGGGFEQTVNGKEVVGLISNIQNMRLDYGWSRVQIDPDQDQVRSYTYEPYARVWLDYTDGTAAQELIHEIDLTTSVETRFGSVETVWERDHDVDPDIGDDPNSAWKHADCFAGAVLNNVFDVGNPCSSGSANQDMEPLDLGDKFRLHRDTPPGSSERSFSVNLAGGGSVSALEWDAVTHDAEWDTFFGGNSGTICFWHKSDSDWDTGTDIAVYWEDTGTTNARVIYGGVGGDAKIQIGDRDEALITHPTANVWNHHCIDNGGSSIQVYLNGELNTTTTQSYTWTDLGTDQNFHIGHPTSGSESTGLYHEIYMTEQSQVVQHFRWIAICGADGDADQAAREAHIAEVTGESLTDVQAWTLANPNGGTGCP